MKYMLIGNNFVPLVNTNEEAASTN